MPTALNEYGDYPLGDEKIVPDFDDLWKNEFSLLPEVPCGWEKQEPFRKFAKQIYERIVYHYDVQDLANIAYEDGQDDGYAEGEKSGKVNTIKKLTVMINTLEKEK